MSKMFCSVNGKKYECLFCRDYVTFIDVNNKDSFFTVDKFHKLSTVLKNSFFKGAIDD